MKPERRFEHTRPHNLHYNSDETLTHTTTVTSLPLYHSSPSRPQFTPPCPSMQGGFHGARREARPLKSRRSCRRIQYYGGGPYRLLSFSQAATRRSCSCSRLPTYQVYTHLYLKQKKRQCAWGQKSRTTLVLARKRRDHLGISFCLPTGKKDAADSSARTKLPNVN